LIVPQLPAIGADGIGFLITTRWLDERDAHDRRRVGEAIATLLAMMGG
jgi:hypothetical protein